MIPQDFFAAIERVVRWVCIVWGGTLLGATMYLLTR